MDPSFGEIWLIPYPNGYTTRGWVPCNGQTLPIQQNTALFSLQLAIVCLNEGYFTGGQLAGMGVQAGLVLEMLPAAPA